VEGWDFGTAFVEHHRYEFGFTLDERDVIVDDVRVRGIGKSFQYEQKSVDDQLKTLERRPVEVEESHSAAQVYFGGGRLETPIYKLGDLVVGAEVHGPAMLADGTQTIVVTPGSTALVLETHVVIDIKGARDKDKYGSVHLLLDCANWLTDPKTARVSERLIPSC